MVINPQHRPVPTVSAIEPEIRLNAVNTTQIHNLAIITNGNWSESGVINPGYIREEMKVDRLTITLANICSAATQNFRALILALRESRAAQ